MPKTLQGKSGKRQFEPGRLSLTQPCSLLLFCLAVWVLVSSTQAQSAAELLSAAAAAMQQGDYEKAEKYCENLLEIAAPTAELYSNLGLARYFQKKMDRAEEAFKQALHHKPELYVPNFFLGRIYVDTRRYQQALPHLERALKSDPGQVMVRRLLAEAFIGLDRFREAIAQYRKLLEKDRNDIESLYNLGRIYQKLGPKAFDKLDSFKDSGFVSLAVAELYAHRPEWNAVTLKHYRQAVENSPDVPGLRIHLGMFLLKTKDWHQAEKTFREELDLDPSSYAAHFGLSVTRLAQGDAAAALAHLNQAVRVRPEFFDPLPPLPVDLESESPVIDRARLGEEAEKGSFGAAYLLSQLSAPGPDGGVTDWRALAESIRDQQRNQALSSIDRADLLAERERLALGKRYIAEKRFEAGVSLLLQGSEAIKDTATAIALARALMHLGHFEDLVELMENRTPPEAEILYLLGTAYQRLFLETMERMFALNPESAWVHVLLGDSYFAEGRFDRAAAEYGAAIRSEPGNPAFHFALGLAHFKQFDFERAVQELTTVIDLDPFHAEGAFMLGSSFLELRRPQEAAPLLRKALDLNPKLIRAHAELGKASAMLGQEKEAIKHLELGAESDEDGSIHYQLFNLYRKLGEREKAEAALRTSQALRRKRDVQGRQRLQIEGVKHPEPRN